MIRTFYMDIEQLSAEDLSPQALQAVSSFRRQKIVLLKAEADKKRSLGAALLLDYALSTVGLREREMEYDTTEHGKPIFRYHQGLHFSLSHSGRYALCSLADRPVGCDIEQLRPDKQRIADRFFTKEENAWIGEAPEAERDDRLFRLWTMKESFLKVTGLGMSLPLTSFSVVMDPDNWTYVRQRVDEHRYHIKEYTLPAGSPDGEMYRVSVCCDALDFAPQAERVEAGNDGAAR